MAGGLPDALVFSSCGKKVYGWVWVLMHKWTGVWWPEVILQPLSTVVFETGCLTGMELAE